jgi:hypothetical protein
MAWRRVFSVVSGRRGWLQAMPGTVGHGVMTVMMGGLDRRRHVHGRHGAGQGQADKAQHQPQMPEQPAWPIG